MNVDNVDRAAFANITPLILVESPTPGQTVGAPLHVHGISNTFEATVNYTLTDPSGVVCPACAEHVIKESFTMATAGTGTWGTFDFDIPFTVERAGPIVLEVYENSAKDGNARCTRRRFRSRSSRSFGKPQSRSHPIGSVADLRSWGLATASIRDFAAPSSFGTVTWGRSNGAFTSTRSSTIRHFRPVHSCWPISALPALFPASRRTSSKKWLKRWRAHAADLDKMQWAIDPERSLGQGAPV